MKTLTIFILLLSFAYNSFGSPLIYKAEKKIETLGPLVEIGSCSTGKFNKIRIVITSDDIAHINKLEILGNAEGDTFVLLSADFQNSTTAIIDLPPTAIKINVKGRGTFKVYVYGE